jgi:hypothetical protein
VKSIICRLLPLTIPLAVALVTPIRAQNPTTPDLSGTWVLNLAKSKLTKDAKVHSETLAIVSSGLNVVMRFNTDGKESAHSYVTDGKERVVAEVQGGQNLEKAYWKKSALVVETFARLKMPNTPTVNGNELWRLKDRWTLSAEGRVLTDEAEGFDAKTRSVYDKQ